MADLLGLHEAPEEVSASILGLGTSFARASWCYRSTICDLGSVGGPYPSNCRGNFLPTLVVAHLSHSVSGTSQCQVQHYSLPAYSTIDQVAATLN